MYTVQQVTDLEWDNAEHSTFTCLVQFQEFGGEMLPFTASPSDPYAHSQEIWSNGIAGIYGPIQEYVDPNQEN